MLVEAGGGGAKVAVELEAGALLDTAEASAFKDI